MTKGKSMWDTAKKLDKKEPENKPIERQVKVEKPRRKVVVDDSLKEVYSNMSRLYKKITEEVGKVFIGQEEVLKQILIAVFTDNHALVEGYPGLGKTLMVRTLSDVMDLKFKRIQCTPDLMPSDITGTYIVDEQDGKKTFRFEKGPVFTNILLADEINRATPKAQSALLESMQERQVTVGPTTYKLERPFLVLATQNPIEMEGTYPLPEAQVDRFLLKILIKYPTQAEENKIIKLYTSGKVAEINNIVSSNQVLSIHELTRQMPISDDCLDYAQNIVSMSRPKVDGVAKKYLDYGASPRAGIGIVLAAKALALVEGRNYVSEKDVEAMAYPVLRHRLILNFESERKGLTTDDVIAELIKEV